MSPGLDTRSAVFRCLFTCFVKRNEKEFGEDFITVFLAGISGDINHVDPRLHGYMPDDIYIKMENVLVVLYCKTLLHMLKYMQEGFYD